MDLHNIQKDEKNDNSVQACKPPTNMHELTRAETNNLTKLATNEKLQTETDNSRDSQRAEGPYSIYSQKTKTFLIISVSFMAIISPLSSAVYLPAIPLISRDLNVSPSLINLTITTYQVGFLLSPHDFLIKLLIAFICRYFKALRHLSLQPFLILTVVGLPILSAALYIWQPTLHWLSIIPMWVYWFFDASNRVEARLLLLLAPPL